MVYNYTCFPGQEARVAAAHRLVLRERALFYEVDEHVGLSHISKPCHACETEYVPTICEPGGPCGDYCGVPVRRYTKVIRLATISSISLESGSPPPNQGDIGCCLLIGPEQLVVREYSSELYGVSAAIAGPKDGAEFIRAVQAQAEKVLHSTMDHCPVEVPHGLQIYCR